MKKVLHIGIDDTDSLDGSCTTHLATVIVTKIFDQVEFLDFPNLIRLNPNIPYKTRGNGSVAIRIMGQPVDLEQCKEITIKTTQELSRIGDKNTNPGNVFVSQTIPSSIKKFSERAMWDVISIKEAEEFNSLPNVEVLKYGNGRGIIGSLGAIGNQLKNDFTYEYLTYRKLANCGSKRLIDEESVIVADKATPLTFSNVDYDYKSIMIVPRGADPVFTGIRGETVEEVRKAWQLIKPLETIDMLMIFRTNQHTNQHFIKEFSVANLKPHLSIITKGEVVGKPRYIEGSHLIFRIKDQSGEIDCAAYEPTKKFRGQLSHLYPGDSVTVFGGIRSAGDKHPMTINVERLQVNSLVKRYSSENPMCDACGSRLKSAGKNKGYKCFKCSSVYRDKEPLKKMIDRTINLGEYLPPIVAHRHLTKPLAREGRDNSGTEKLPQEVNSILDELMSFNRKSDCF